MGNSKVSIGQNPSMARMKEQLQLMKQMMVNQSVVRVLELSSDSLTDLEKKLVDLEIEFNQLVRLADEFNSHFGQRGWVLYSGIQLKLQEEVVKLAQEGRYDDADVLLINIYDEKFIRLRILIMMFIPEFKPRERLLLLALEDYLAGRYHACIPVILSQIDGLVNDITKYGFFAKSTNLEVNDSITAHSTGLPILQRLFSKDRIRTNDKEITIPYRNGIFHGTDLRYDNQVVAAKAWATLFALRDWVIDLRQYGTKKQPQNLSWKEKIGEIVETRQEVQRIAQWKPRDAKVIKERILSASNGDIDKYPESVMFSFLEMWNQEKYGRIVPFLSKIHQKGSVNATAGWVRSLLESCKLKKYSVEDVKDENPFCTDIYVQISVYKRSLINNLIKIRLIHEDTNGDFVSVGNQKGEWKILLTPIIALAQD